MYDVSKALITFTLSIIKLLFYLMLKHFFFHQISPSGKLLLDFVIDSKDDRNLIAFLMPSISGSESFVNKKYFLKMQSEQYFERTKKTLFERYLYIKDNDTRDEFFELCFYLFEEMDFIHDIQHETCVDVALILANIHKYEGGNNNNDVKKILNSDEGKEIFEAVKDETVKFDHEYDCDKLLKYFAAYWTKNDLNYTTYKLKLIGHSPFFTMMAHILEGNEDDFFKSFHDNVNDLVLSYNLRYHKIESNETMMQEDLFILFRTAMKNDQRKIMKCILNYESFETLQFNFPSYKKADKNNHYAALMLLESGYALGDKSIPDDWISEQIMSEFLDSQVKVIDQELVQMNTNLLLCNHDRKYKIKSKDDVDNLMLFHEWNESLKFILENEALHDLILHPIVSTYINLKSYKYQRIYELNFVLFFFLYLLPFGLLITYHSFDNINETFSAYFLRILEIICTCSTSLLTIREFGQMVWVSKSLKDYFWQKTNQLELAMIFLSWTLLLGIFWLDLDEHSEAFSFVSTLFIILSTTELLTMLPFKSMPIYMMMLKTVAATFLRFFCFFVFILFSFSISFCVIFRPKNGKSISDSLKPSNETDEEISKLNEDFDGAVKKDDDDDNEVYQNFDTIARSFFKTVLMLSGEYTIEPFTLNMTKMIIFFIFVLTSFVLFNLILGLAVDDVQGVRREAEILNLRYEAKKFIDSARKWKEFFYKHE